MTCPTTSATAKQLTLLTLLVVFLVTANLVWLCRGTATAAAPEKILVLLDLSHSMNRSLKGTPKIKLARQAFAEVLATIPASTQLALRGFGQGKSGRRTEDCQASQMLAPFGGSREKLLEVVRRTKPEGRKTPITYALELAREDLRAPGGGAKVILISDGLENCFGNPYLAAKLLAAKGITVDVIGIGEPESLAPLGGIAMSGGGKFYASATGTGLTSALQETMATGTKGAGGGAKAAGGGGGGGMAGAAAAGKGSGAGGAPTGAQGAGAGPQAPPAGPAGSAGQSGTLVKVMPAPASSRPSVAKPARPRKAPSDSPVMHLEIILDASGSMAASMHGQSKMALAKKALAQTVTSLSSPLVSLAFRAYGFDRSLPKTPEASCPNTELLVPFGQGNARAIIKAAKGLDAYGYTPLARSLELAGRDLAPHKKQHPSIILISDGKETCGGDPVAVIARLRRQGIEVKVNVIGFDLDTAARKQLKAVAAAGRGSYYDAADFNGLIAGLRSIVDQVQATLAQAAPERYLRPVAAGTDLASAPRLGPGRYTLKDNVLKGKAGYFLVPAGKARMVEITGRIQAGRLVADHRKKGSLTEAKTAAGGFTIKLFNLKGKELKGRRTLVRGEVGQEATARFMDLDGRGMYFSVGDDFSNVHKDAMFTVKVYEAGDIYQGQEAPAKPTPAALPLPAGETITGHLGLEDRADTYVLQGLGKGGKELDLQIAFADQAFRFKLELYQPRAGKKAKRLGRFVRLTGKARLKIPLPAGLSAVYLRVVDNNPRLYNLFSSYRLTATPR